MTLSFEQAKNKAIEVATLHKWCSEFKRIDTLPDGAWVFWCVDPLAPWEDERKAVVVRQDDGFPSALYGAIGKVYFSRGQPHALGLPKSTERWIGSGPGRYQLFDKGIIVWDAITRWASTRISQVKDFEKGLRLRAYVAFFDLRSFTKRASQENDPDKIQKIVNALEFCIQNILYKMPLHKDPDLNYLFVKGLGDGVMLVLEDNQIVDPPASKFLVTCAQIINHAKCHPELDLQIGCGTDYGELNRVFLFGQWDYLGNSVNIASKLQGEAKNSIIVSETFQSKLASEDSTLSEKGKRFISEKNPPLNGVQYQPEDIAPQ